MSVQKSIASSEIANNTIPQSLEIHATIESISLNAPYSGDDNQNNAAVAYYRRIGHADWQLAHFMTNDYKARQWQVSLVYLAPDTEYEIEVRYQDPDGVSPSVSSATIRTRPHYPIVGDNGRIWTIPTDGTLQNILHNNAQPGDTIQLLTGTYTGETTLFPPHSGLPEHYITIEPAPGAAVVFDGSDVDINSSEDNWHFYTRTKTGDIYYTDLDWASTICDRSTMLPNYIGEENNDEGSRYLLFDSGTQNWADDFLPAPHGKAYYVCDENGPGPIGRLYVLTHAGDDPDNHQMHISRYRRAFHLQGADYLRIRGFEIRYYGLSGIHLIDYAESGADHNIIENNVFHGIGEWHVRLAGAPGQTLVADNLIQNNTFYERGYRDSQWQWDVYYHHGRGDVTMVSLAGTGYGNVIRDNQFEGGHDAINVNKGAHGADVYRNEIHECMDNGIEVDSIPGQNVRVWQNRIVNCFASLSFQGWHGDSGQGPVYVFRNIIVGGDDPLRRTDDLGGIKGYNSGAAFKLGSNHGYSGHLFLYHNTISIISRTFGKGHSLNDSGGNFFANAVTRNNIWHVTGDVLSFNDTTSIANHDFDCDNLHDLNGAANTFIVWGGTGGPEGDGRYTTLDDFQFFTGQERNGISDNSTQFDTDFHLLAGSPDIDAGCLIPGFNDRGLGQFIGAAPDIGAVEYFPADYVVFLPAVVR